MLDRHEPDEQFVDKLEWQIAGEVRRRNRATTQAHPMWRWARVAALVLISMSLGAAAVAATYQIEESWRRELLVAGLEVRIELARQRLTLAGQEVQRTERQVAAGALSEATLTRVRMDVANSRTHLQRMELDLEEVRISGREPRDDIAAPLVGGRDFVSERIQLQLEAMSRHRAAVIGEMRDAQRRADAGVTADTEVGMAQAQVRAIQAQRAELDGRLAYRQGFLDGDLTAVEAELYLLREEAESREEALRANLAPYVTGLDNIRARVAAGAETDSTLLQAQLQVAQMEAELRLAEQELEIIERELNARRQAQR